VDISNSVKSKSSLRARLRAERRSFVDSLPKQVSALVFLRPPRPVAAALAGMETVAVYRAMAAEAPAQSYAQWLYDNGHKVALPWFADRSAPMQFRQWHNPYDDSELETGPWGPAQPDAQAPLLVPQAAFVPLVGFTADGQRLGQGGGHYDRFLAANPKCMALGLAWDCQLCADLPTESHDRQLAAVVTPTRLYGEL
jgi:5-formyltetrahydrofolate cyclo-ligase